LLADFDTASVRCAAGQIYEGLVINEIDTYGQERATYIDITILAGSSLCVAVDHQAFESMILVAEIIHTADSIFASMYLIIIDSIDQDRCAADGLAFHMM